MAARGKGIADASEPRKINEERGRSECSLRTLRSGVKKRGQARAAVYTVYAKDHPSVLSKEA